jgi:hypothetical protein
MRMLVLSTQRELTMSARILMTLGAGLVAHGQKVAFACCKDSPAEAEISRRFPDIPLRRLDGGSALRQASLLRSMVKAERIEGMLVGTERDQLTAALAVGRQGGVVRRLGVGEQFAPTWRARLASSRANCLLMGDETGASVNTSAPVRAGIAWPRPLAQPGDASLQLDAVPPPSVIAIVAGVSQVPAQHAAGAAALRAVARLLSRHEDLRVLLLGEIPALQALRLHSASVGLADRVSVMPLDALIESGAFAAASVWVTATGDTGAVSIVSAMMRRIPVIVPRGFDTEALVAPRITGFVADESDASGSIAALAHLFADPEAHSAMGTVAASRAARLHGWDAMLGRTAETIVRAATRTAKTRRVT